MKKFAIITLMAALVAALGATQDMFPQESTEQINVDETELAQFVDALQQIEQVQMETQEEMISVLNDLDLSTDRFNELYQAEHNPEFELEQPLSDDEEQRYRMAEQELQGIQEDSQVEMSQVVENQGIDIDRFNEIYVALTQDPELQQRVQDIMN
ncbi:MAG: DUF4168 domain-containing protein [Spirochaetaceae bacterium]|nr:MAG: DUF4168 domain-containing protein [Spirochaetaceae bacterium]